LGQFRGIADRGGQLLAAVDTVVLGRSNNHNDNGDQIWQLRGAKYDDHSLPTANSLIERRSLNLLASAAVRALLINGGPLFFEPPRLSRRELGSHPGKHEAPNPRSNFIIVLSLPLPPPPPPSSANNGPRGLVTSAVIGSPRWRLAALEKGSRSRLAETRRSRMTIGVTFGHPEDCVLRHYVDAYATR